MPHFSEAEFLARKARLLAAMAEARLDGLLMFEQESMYWLTGYDSFGFCFFQCLFLGQDGRIALLTRSADLRHAELTSIISDIRIWKDAFDADPVRDLRGLLADYGANGGQLGVEYQSYGLTAAWGKRLDCGLEGFARLVDASGLVGKLRAVKSPAEITFVRKAAELSDRADRVAIELLRAGADEGEILAAQNAEIFRAGGDYPANEFIIGSGPEALLCRYKSGRRTLAARDQLTLEFAGTWRRYHAAIMRTHIVGQASDLHLAYHRAAREALLACEAEMKPGRTAGDVFAAHIRIFAALGLSEHCLNACGYSLGAKFTPSWMDPPMFYADNPWPIEAGMVMFAHMILMDSRSGTAMCLGRTSLISKDGAEPLNALNLDLVVR